MAEQPEFQRLQYAFAAHIRDPQNAPAPEGIEDRRMAVYRELFFNNLKSLLANMFPVMKKLHEPDRWNYFIRQFLRQHRASTPYFLQLPQEFLAFLQDEYQRAEDDYPFLLELAHYEYVELALSISEEKNDLGGIDPEGDMLSGIPVKSALAWAYAYQYPVHRVAKDFVPLEPLAEPVFLVVHRDEDDKVEFTELNAVTAALLDAVEKNKAGRTGAELLHDLAKNLGFSNTDAFTGHGEAALGDMRAKGILLGTQI